MEQELLTLTDEDGKEKTYRILSTYMYKDKNYIVYTDDTHEGDKLNIYASIFDPEDDSVFENVTTEEEWNIAKEILNKIGGK